MPVLVNVRRTIGASCFSIPKSAARCLHSHGSQPVSRCPWQRVGSKRPLVYQPLVPHILTACYQVVLLPPCDLTLAEWLPVAQDVYYAVALFLQVRTAHPDLIQKHQEVSAAHTPPKHANHLCQALC